MRVYSDPRLNVFFIETVSNGPVVDYTYERKGDQFSFYRPLHQYYDVINLGFDHIQDANGNGFTSGDQLETYLKAQLQVTVAAPGSGPAGANGVRGSLWTSGTGAPSAASNVGDMYLDTQASDVYQYTSSGWVKVTNIKGATGAASQVPGPAGKDGKDGADSQISGPRGDVGPVGPASTVPGPQGVSGVRGSLWLTGSGVPAASNVMSGDLYLDTSTGDVYRWA